MYSNLASSTSALPCFSFSSMRRRAVVVKAVSVSTFAADPTAAGKNFSLYEVLRVKRTASPTEIKTAYRSLAKMYHPDAVIRRHVDESADGQDFIEIHNAYETLSDPATRAVYDLSLAATIAGGSYYRRMRGGGGGGYHPTRRWETDQCW